MASKEARTQVTPDILSRLEALVSRLEALVERPGDLKDLITQFLLNAHKSELTAKTWAGVQPPPPVSIIRHAQAEVWRAAATQLEIIQARWEHGR